MINDLIKQLESDPKTLSLGLKVEVIEWFISMLIKYKHTIQIIYGSKEL